MKLNVHETMTRVHAEVARMRGMKVAAEHGLENSGFMGSWSGSLPPIATKPAYILYDLLAYSDRAFVENAYAAILRRTPDAEGLRMHLHKLRSGEATKVEVLAALRWSEEGKALSVHVDGLLVPYLLQKWKRRRFLGPLLAWGHGMLRLGTVMQRTSEVEAAQARELADLGGHVNQVAARIEARLAALSHAIDASRRETSQVSGEVASRMSVLTDEMASQISALTGDMTSRMSTLTDEMASRTSALTDDMTSRMSTLTDDTTSRTSALTNELGIHVDRLDECAAQLLDCRNQLAAHGALLAREESERQAIASFQRSLDPLYVAFEQRFRGSSELIRARVMPYLDILRDAQVGDLTKPVLDIGCGNGDWLDVLREHGFSARGVDSNQIFVDLCRGRGLDVIHGDALEFLRQLPTGSLGAVTGMHIAEHLPFEVLVALIDECRRVLCIGGVLALETPNPENLLVGSHFFYVDPTHRNPLPPETLRWIVEARGFQLSRIERWSVARELPAPPLLASDPPGAESVNALLSQLHVAPDYAVIARRL